MRSTFYSVSMLIVLQHGLFASAQPTSHDKGTQSTMVSIILDSMKLPESWVGIHAAEAAIPLGMTSEVREQFRPQAESHKPGYRIGVWRLLSQVEEDAAQRQQFSSRILDVFRNPESGDRVHAIEAMAKLEMSLDDSDLQILSSLSEQKGFSGRPFVY